MDRRTSMQWMLAAAAVPSLAEGASAVAVTARRSSNAKAPGYGTDPVLTHSHKQGELWPLTFDAAQTQCAAALCALIIPADERSPSAAALEVHRFIDEWVSAPYPQQQKDKALIVEGLAWIDAEAKRRFGGKAFGELDDAQKALIAEAICWREKAAPELARPAAFFARFRDLTAGGFYTTPQGMNDLGFVGNRPSATFEGPPEAALKIVGVI